MSARMGYQSIYREQINVTVRLRQRVQTTETIKSSDRLFLPDQITMMMMMMWGRRKTGNLKSASLAKGDEMAKVNTTQLRVVAAIQFAFNSKSFIRRG